MASWSEVTKLRNPVASGPGVEALLDQLATSGDLDAAIQLELLNLDRRVQSRELTDCEAFAEALAAIARAIQKSTEGRDVLGGVRSTPWTDEVLRARFLAYAWAYLVTPDDRDTLISFLTADDRVERSGLVQHTPAGDWDAVAPPWSATHEDGRPGTGYLPKRSDDPIDDTAGRKAHFLANAQFGFRYGPAGAIPSAVMAALPARFRGEDSTTDLEVNGLGVEFGRALARGDLKLDDITPWVKRKLCREGKCAEGKITEDLLKKLENGLIKGEVKYSHKEIFTMNRTGSRPLSLRQVDTRTEKMTVVARVTLRSGAREAEFGPVVEGKWSATTSRIETGADDQQRSGGGPVLHLRGALVVDGEDAGAYWISVEGGSTDDAAAITNYGFGAGEGRRVCADGTLSGSIVRNTSDNKESHYEDPRNFGEMLRGGGVPYTESRFNTFESELNWKFTFETAPPPPHVPICAERYDFASVMSAVSAFFTDASTRLAAVGGRMSAAGRLTEAQHLMGLFGPISAAMGPVATSLSERTQAIENACRELETLWAIDDQVKYQQVLQTLTINAEAWKREKVAFLELLATEGEKIANAARQEDAEAAADLDNLVSTLRRDGR